MLRYKRYVVGNMKHFWILALCGWLSTVNLYGDWFYVVLTREREDLYSFEVQVVGDFTSVTGKISASNEHETSVSPWGEVINVVSAGTIVTFEINGQAFMLTGDRYVTLWTKRAEPEGVQNNDKFFVEMREQTPLRKEKEPPFHLNFDNLRGEVEVMNREGKSDFTIINPYNDHPWFSNKPVGQIKFPKPVSKSSERKKKPMKNKDYSGDDMGYFLRKK